MHENDGAAGFQRAAFGRRAGGLGRAFHRHLCGQCRRLRAGLAEPLTARSALGAGAGRDGHGGGAGVARPGDAAGPQGAWPFAGRRRRGRAAFHPMVRR
ncbi:MAG: hypothetical protein EON47_00185 [Acetobacteraceae bacterium]|nr:MAG: hypothetical protein EON47_00185 [Acetobacteraceae bacterium]